MHRRFLLLVALALPVLALMAAVLSPPQSASAHPLGNFTVNRYSRLELYADAVRVRYVLDMAEIPTFQETPVIDVNGDGDLSASEADAYLEGKASEIAGNLNLRLNGSTASIETLSSDISFPEGQAGLRTLRIDLLLHASTSDPTVSLEYDDQIYADRVGWKEVVVRPADGVLLSNSTAASEDVSSELTNYPSDLLSSPLDVSSASVLYDASGAAPAPAVSDTTGVSDKPASAPTRAGGRFASLVDSERLTLPVVVLSLLLALGFGAVHALEPGHGKTLVAAYFVGIKGTARQAIGLGLIIAVTHTIGVLAIGLVVLFGSQYILPERLYPWLSLASGVMILALGVRLIAARAGGWRGVKRFFSILGRDRSHGSHGHDHADGHTHEIDTAAPPWKALVALGLADGLTPSPSALIVLLAAVSLDRIGLGLLLIVAFSVGLAAVLTLICLALLYARRMLEWISSRRASTAGAGHGRWAGLGAGTSALARVAPLGGAVALVAIGLLLTVRALTQPGLPIL